MNGTFVAFEGVDGSGKSTLMHQVAAKLLEDNLPVTTTFEPGGTQLGQILRQEALKAASDPITELLLFAADRADHVRRVIRPALRENRIVLTDRYEASSIAYQGAWRGIGERQVAHISAVATDNLKPHLTIWVDVSEQTAKQRRSEPVNQMDTAAKDAYLYLAGSFQKQAEAETGWYALDGESPLESQVDKVCQMIKQTHEERSRKGRLIVLCGPSGSGKSTLVSRLKSRGDVDYCLSATTRPQREGEHHMIDYMFVDQAGFEELARQGGLAETTDYAGHLYGTLRDQLKREDHRHKIAVVELAGARSIRRIDPDALIVFLTVDEKTLAERLLARQSETTEQLDLRMRQARTELRVGPGFSDFQLDGNDLEAMLAACEELLGPVPLGRGGTKLSQKSESGPDRA